MLTQIPARVGSKVAGTPVGSGGVWVGMIVGAFEVGTEDGVGEGAALGTKVTGSEVMELSVVELDTVGVMVADVVQVVMVAIPEMDNVGVIVADVVASGVVVVAVVRSEMVDTAVGSRVGSRAGVGAPVSAGGQIPRSTSLSGLVCPSVMHRPTLLLQPQRTPGTAELVQLFEHNTAWHRSMVGLAVVRSEMVGTAVESRVGAGVAALVAGMMMVGTAVGSRVGAGVGAPVSAVGQIPRSTSLSGLVCPSVMHRPTLLLQPQRTPGTAELVQLFEHNTAWHRSMVGLAVGSDVDGALVRFTVRVTVGDVLGVAVGEYGVALGEYVADVGVTEGARVSNEIASGVVVADVVASGVVTVVSPLLVPVPVPVPREPCP